MTGLAVGAAGKVGRLELELRRTGGTTRIHRQYHRAPLHVYQPIHLDPGRPDMAFVFLQQSGDGLVQGDRYRIDIRCGPGTAAHITTQSATNVYRADRDVVTQTVDLRADEGAVLEYLPDPLVPFRGARLFGRTSITADRSSIVIAGETLLPGRVAHGEAHDYDVICLETEVRRSDGTLLVADLLHLDPAGLGHPRSLGLLGAHDVLATLFVLAGEADAAALVGVLRQALDACPGVVAGATVLPHDCGAVARILGSGSREVKHAMRSAWNAVRIALLGVEAPDLRKG